MINTIFPAGGTELSSLVQNASAGKSGTKGLLEFFNLILGNTAVVQPASGGQDLAAKLAALLKSNPDLKSNDTVQALMQALQAEGGKGGADGISAQVLRDQLSKILQVASPKDADIRPTLTSDLAGLVAPAIQSTPMPADKEAFPDSNDTAALFNTIEPQAGDSQQDAVVRVDPNVIQQLEAKLATLINASGAASSEALAQHREDLIHFLKSKGFSPPVIQEYISVLEQTIGQKQAATIQSFFPQQASTPLKQDQVSKKNGEQAAIESAEPTETKKSSSAQPIHASIVNALVSDAAKSGSQENTIDQSPTQLLAHNDTSAQGIFRTDGATAQTLSSNIKDVSIEKSPTTQLVSLQLQANASQRVDTMTLQLHPSELGQLSIKMKFDKDGGIKAHLIADKPETLALLQRDSNHLQRALQQAGFNADENAISFDLSQQNQNQQDLGSAQDHQRRDGRYSSYAVQANDNLTVQASIALAGGILLQQGRVNIMV